MSGAEERLLQRLYENTPSEQFERIRRVVGQNVYERVTTLADEGGYVAKRDGRNRCVFKCENGRTPLV